MREVYNEYKQKLRKPVEIIDMIKDNYYISAGQVAGNPNLLFDNLHLLKGKAKNVTLQTSLMLQNHPFLEDEEMGEYLKLEAWFYGGFERNLHNKGLASFCPAHLSLVAPSKLMYKKPNMFWGVSAPMDEHGNLSISFGVAYEMEMLENADIVVIEINENAPRTFGQNVFNIKDVDFVVESNLPVNVVTPTPLGEIDEIIGKKVASLVEDGSTIQLGIGNIPNAVAKYFRDKNDLGVHTEMITDSMYELYDMGVITNKKKTFFKDKMVGTFVYGQQSLYDFVNNNPMVYMMRGPEVNNPWVIAQNDNMCSINTAIQVDLTGQVCSESLGSRQYSGTGGQFDTAHGAQRSKGGKSIIALHSTAKKGTVSTIAPFLTEGSIVSLSRNDVNYIVTEYGIANLRGRSIYERVEQLINVAHPNFRDELRAKAKEMKIW